MSPLEPAARTVIFIGDHYTSPMDIRPLTLDDQQAWSELLAVSFSRTPKQMALLLSHFYGERRLVAWGAWDGKRLVAQYSCLLAQLWLPNGPKAQTVGMSVNMAVHPDYRGRGLVKQVSQPVYDEVGERGGIAGVGFSNAAGIKVDKRSKGYGYQVVGQMIPSLAILIKSLRPSSVPPLILTPDWPKNLTAVSRPSPGICFATTPDRLRHRFGRHPFRRYQFGLQVANDRVEGVVVYRPFRRWGLSGASLLLTYGADQDALLAGWLQALLQHNIRLIHVVTSPQAALRRALQQQTWCLPLFKSQTPYFLTAKPLQQQIPETLFQFENWDCVGGDIL